MMVMAFIFSAYRRMNRPSHTHDPAVVRTQSTQCVKNSEALQKGNRGTKV